MAMTHRLVLLLALVTRAATQNATQDAHQGDAASDTAALLAIRAFGGNAAHVAMVTWTAGTEPCAVCMSDLSAGGDQLKVLPCGHAFKPACINEWLRKQPTCPICRQPVIASRDEINLYEMMQQRNQMNQHEDDLASGVMQV